MLDPVLHRGRVPRSFVEALQQLIGERERELALPNLNPVRQAFLIADLVHYRAILCDEERSHG